MVLFGLSACRALTPCRDWTRPETDCLQNSKEKVDFFNSRYTPEQGGGGRGREGGRGGRGVLKRDREKKRKYNMHKILPDEHCHSYCLVIAAPMPLLKTNFT